MRLPPTAEFIDSHRQQLRDSIMDAAADDRSKGRWFKGRSLKHRSRNRWRLPNDTRLAPGQKSHKGWGMMSLTYPTALLLASFPTFLLADSSLSALTRT
jgi:hypothetical protein